MALETVARLRTLLSEREKDPERSARRLGHIGDADELAEATSLGTQALRQQLRGAEIRAVVLRAPLDQLCDLIREVDTLLEDRQDTAARIEAIRRRFVHETDWTNQNHESPAHLGRGPAGLSTGRSK